MATEVGVQKAVCGIGKERSLHWRGILTISPAMGYPNFWLFFSFCLNSANLILAISM